MLLLNFVYMHQLFVSSPSRRFFSVRFSSQSNYVFLLFDLFFQLNIKTLSANEREREMDRGNEKFHCNKLAMKSGKMLFLNVLACIMSANCKTSK